MSRLFIAVILVLIAACADPGVHPVVGTVERDRIVLTAESREPITAIHVREGDRVDVDALLVELDEGRAQAEYDRQQARIDRLQSRLAELARGPRAEEILEARARLDAIDSTLETATHEYERLERLRAEGLASERELERARGDRDRLRAEQDAAQASLEAMLSGTTGEELDQARANIAEAEASMRSHVLYQARLAVRAPRAAVVEALPFRLGETPQRGDALVVLRATDRPPYARVYVPASLQTRMTAGTRVRMDIDGVEYQGVVRYISSEVAYTPYFALTEHDADRLSYVAEIDIEAGENLPSGVPVRALMDE